ncbi:hypothetical protein AciX9_0771 [Granulicella tundricola MP5ACTX9]|uniref:Uncharacterized protein n=1 Tax=Granulicella tundricola (strain ATCC BAA-1859 / DSM 23138 / MP5ACTX9) TaxID=1198114 RepID=E8X0H6_GRATM|nr:hypothetical protein AciX9_0771 [Granulicella tundricola MP5ACTX9]
MGSGCALAARQTAGGCNGNDPGLKPTFFVGSGRGPEGPL